MYVLSTVEFILEHYWEIKSGRIPHVPGYSSNSMSDRSTAMIWCADLDRGIDHLSKKYAGRWLSVCDKLTPARLQTMIHKFSGWQQLLFKHYLLGDKDLDTKRVVRTLRYKMNQGTKEAELVDQIVHSIKVEDCHNNRT